MRTWKVLSLLVGAAALALFAACAGGGGGSPEPEKDATADEGPGTDAVDDVGTDQPTSPDAGQDTKVEKDEGGGEATTPDTGTDVCQPNCEGKECGDDGCGGSCGACADGEECSADGQCVPCQPKCDGKECGDDGCGGTCGDCPTDKPVCTTDGLCIEECELPQQWGPAGYIAQAQIPKTTDAQNVCPDYSGDGKGDNGLAVVASMANPELQNAIDEGKFVILFEFVDVTDFANTPDFTLNGLAGEQMSPGPNEYLVSPEAYDETCTPIIYFEGASISSGVLQAGPSKFELMIPVQDLPLKFTLIDAQVTGNVIEGGPDGVVVEDGVIAGVLTKEEIENTLAVLQEQCDQADPKPSWCGYLSTAKQFINLIFDLDRDGDGQKDAASVCLTYTLGKAVIIGFAQTDGGGQ